MASDLLVTPENVAALKPDRPAIKRKIALQLQLGPGIEITNPPAIHMSIVRSDAIFGEILRKVGSQSNLRAAFERNTGMALEDYVDHVLGILTYYVTLDFHKLIDDPGLASIALKTFFAQSAEEIVLKFWRSELTTFEALRATLTEESELKPHHDFMAFRKRPVLEVAPGVAIPLHLGFLQEKLETGLFWAVFNSLGTRQERSDLFTDWGHLFEAYVSQVLDQRVQGPREKYFAFPTFSDNGDEAFDGVICAEECWVVMEYKGGFLSATAKYAEDEGKFIDDLDRKFGAAKGAGVEQLVRKVASIFAERPAARRSLNGLSAAGVRVVIPVLIVQDAFVSSELTSSYLVDAFETLKRKHRLDRGRCVHLSAGSGCGRSRSLEALPSRGKNLAP